LPTTGPSARRSARSIIPRPVGGGALVRPRGGARPPGRISSRKRRIPRLPGIAGVGARPRPRSCFPVELAAKSRCLHRPHQERVVGPAQLVQPHGIARRSRATGGRLPGVWRGHNPDRVHSVARDDPRAPAVREQRAAVWPGAPAPCLWRLAGSSRLGGQKIRTRAAASIGGRPAGTGHGCARRGR
jgi:hypothetical protein